MQIDEHPIKVLLVDDDEDEFILTQDLLDDISNVRYELDWVATFAEGLQAIKDAEHDIYLIDYRLGDHTGLDLLQSTRGVSRNAPMILLTGVGDYGIDMKAMEAGAADYLIKGEITAPLLERTIRYAINHARTLESLRVSEERYAAAVKSANDGLWDWDFTKDKVYYSPRWKFILGYQECDIGTQPDEWLSRIHSEDRDNVITEFEAHKNGLTDLFINEHRILHRDGEYRWVLVRGLVLTDEQSNPLSRMAGSLTDITDRKRFENQLLYDALHDALTGLPNRVLLIERLSNAHARQRRYPEYRYAVLFLDLDRFKIINDSLGHLAGDQMLKIVAKRLQSCLRPGDTIARLGGDEFAIFLEYIEDDAEVRTVAERIETTLQEPVLFDNNEVYTTGSIGIALGNASHERPEDILRDADIALYCAKDLGKARYTLFDKSMYTQVAERVHLERDLRQAIEKREFFIQFQPIISSATELPWGFEALVRWHHPKLGVVPPAHFIGLAEETELILPLGWWVLEEACRRMQTLNTPGDRSPLSISVNLSAKQFSQNDLITRITAILERTGLAPERLNLEITESTIMESSYAAITKLQELKQLGIRCHIDDFGTGYSSLSYLYRFPSAALKIDRSFIRKMTDSRQHAGIVQTIINLAHNLEMFVIAEGVETSQQFIQLKELNCEYIQGFWYSLPLDWKEVLALLGR